MAPLFEIPYPVLRSWIVNQIIPLEQKGVTVRLDVNVDAYPNNLNVAVLIRVLERCMNLAEKTLGQGAGDRYWFPYSTE